MSTGGVAFLDCLTTKSSETPSIDDDSCEGYDVWSVFQQMHVLRCRCGV